MADKGETELLSVLANPGDYVPEALEAAADEIRKRKLSGEQAAVLQGFLERRKAELREFCPHCLSLVSFESSSVCVHCGKDKTLVRFLCRQCSQPLQAPVGSAGNRIGCASCGSEDLVPGETPYELIIESKTTSKELYECLTRLRAAFLRTGRSESAWTLTLAELINMAPEKVMDHLRTKNIENTVARAGTRAIQILGPSLRTHAAKTINKHIVRGSLYFVGGLLFTVVSYAGAANSGGIYWIAYGAIITGGVHLFIGLRQASKHPRISDDPNRAYQGPRCVSCEAPIEMGTKTCPHCSWTQPI